MTSETMAELYQVINTRQAEVMEIEDSERRFIAMRDLTRLIRKFRADVGEIWNGPKTLEEE